MKGWDANGNGMIEESEVEGRRRYYAVRMLQGAGLPEKFPIAITKIHEGLKKRAGSEGDKQNSSDENKIPGFGVESELTPPPGFGKPDDEDEPPAGSRGSSGSSGTSNRSSPSHSYGSTGHSQLRDHARGLVKKYDKNGNGVLDKDEWGEMSRSHWSADLDRDSRITSDELTRWLVAQNRERSGDSGGSTDVVAASHRVLTTAERLPGGLPSWFEEKDANGDGQVAMCEYESNWNDSKVSAFLRYDWNNDGMITPRECLYTENDK